MRGEPASRACGSGEQSARTARALFYVAPSDPPCFELRQMATRCIPHGHVLERRLLTLKGAVFGVLPSGSDGARATHVAVPHRLPSPNAGWIGSFRGDGLAVLFHDRVAGP